MPVDIREAIAKINEKHGDKTDKERQAILEGAIDRGLVTQKSVESYAKFPALTKAEAADKGLLSKAYAGAGDVITMPARAALGASRYYGTLSGGGSKELADAEFKKEMGGGGHGTPKYMGIAEDVARSPVTYMPFGAIARPFVAGAKALGIGAGVGSKIATAGSKFGKGGGEVAKFAVKSAPEGAAQAVAEDQYQRAQGEKQNIGETAAIGAIGGVTAPVVSGLAGQAIKGGAKLLGKSTGSLAKKIDETYSKTYKDPYKNIDPDQSHYDEYYKNASDEVKKKIDAAKRQGISLTKAEAESDPSLDNRFLYGKSKDVNEAIKKTGSNELATGRAREIYGDIKKQVSGIGLYDDAPDFNVSATSEKVREKLDNALIKYKKAVTEKYDAVAPESVLKEKIDTNIPRRAIDETLWEGGDRLVNLGNELKAKYGVEFSSGHNPELAKKANDFIDRFAKAETAKDLDDLVKEMRGFDAAQFAKNEGSKSGTGAYLQKKTLDPILEAITLARRDVYAGVIGKEAASKLDEADAYFRENADFINTIKNVRGGKAKIENGEYAIKGPQEGVDPKTSSAITSDMAKPENYATTMRLMSTFDDADKQVFRDGIKAQLVDDILNPSGQLKNGALQKIIRNWNDIGEDKLENILGKEDAVKLRDLARNVTSTRADIAGRLEPISTSGTSEQTAIDAAKTAGEKMLGPIAGLNVLPAIGRFLGRGGAIEHARVMMGKDPTDGFKNAQRLISQYAVPIGTGVPGAVIGAATGYIGSDQEDENKARNALIGAGAGFGAGAALGSKGYSALQKNTAKKLEEAARAYGKAYKY